MRGFKDKRLDEDSTFIVYETHIFVNLDDGRTLAIEGDTEVEYSNVVSRNMCLTITMT